MGDTRKLVMLDTVVVVSPKLEEEVAQAIEVFLHTRYGVNNQTGEEDYRFVSGSLPGSFSSSVSVNVKREEFVVTSALGSGARTPTVEALPCEPYLRVEGSVHKAILGHNIFGGPLCPVAGTRWFIEDISRRVGVLLPDSDSWLFERVDWSEVYDLGDFKAVHEFIESFAHARYPRRGRRLYKSECAFFPGTTSAMKFYHKGPEFTKNSFKAFPSQEHAILLQAIANKLLRVECSIKSKKLKADFGEKPTVVQVTRGYCEAVHDRETLRVMREGKEDMDLVRSHDGVRIRLRDLYGDQLGNVLFGTWSSLAFLGEDSVRSTMTRPTFYRHRKQLEDAGISWLGTDVYVRRETAIPEGFSPNRRDSRRLTTEAPEVSEALSAYSFAATA